MRSERSLHRRLYAAILRFYPKPYRERFGEGMEQTFNDLYTEHARAGESVIGFTLHAYADTLFGIFKEQILFLSSTSMVKSFVRVIIGTALLLSVPLIAKLTTEEFGWSVFDFILVGSLIFVAGFIIEMLFKGSKDAMYRTAVVITVLTTFFMTFVNIGVGIIGDEAPVSTLYFLVIPIGFIGLAASRLKPKGLSYTLYLMAAVTMAVPVVAVIIKEPELQVMPGVLGVFVLSGIIASAYLGCGLLFRNAAEKR